MLCNESIEQLFPEPGSICRVSEFEETVGCCIKRAVILIVYVV